MVEGLNLLGEVMISDNLGASTEDDGVEADRLEKIRIGRQKVADAPTIWKRNGMGDNFK